MSNTPFLFIGIPFIVSIMISFIVSIMISFGESSLSVIRGSTNVSFWELPAVRRTSVSVLCDNLYDW